MYCYNNVLRLGFFKYKDNFYNKGTNVLYNGKCILNDKEVTLSNVVVEFLYNDSYWWFKYNNQIYKCKSFENNIVSIIADKPNINMQPKTKEVVWTDEMVAATIWYIIIMLFATIFNARIAIWIIATIIWRGYINKNKIEIWR